jgi:hypothetical protein
MTKAKRWTLAVVASAGLCFGGILLVRLFRKHLKAARDDASTSGSRNVSQSLSENEEYSETRDGNVLHLPVLGFRFDDEEFRRYELVDRKSWLDSFEDEGVDAAPSVILVYGLVQDPLKPQITFIVEDLMNNATTAQEYLEKTKREDGLPMSCFEVDIPTVLSSAIESLIELDVVCCAFSEPMEKTPCGTPGSEASTAVRAVINVVIVYYGIAIILQLICAEPSLDQQMPMFVRLLLSLQGQLQNPENEIQQRAKRNLIRFGLPSVRQGIPGISMTLPIGRLQIMPQQHVAIQNLVAYFRKACKQNPLNIIGCLEKRTANSRETTETFLVQFGSAKAFEAVNAYFSQVMLDLGRPSFLCSKKEYLSLVIIVAGTNAEAEAHGHSVCSGIKPFLHQKKSTQYVDGFSGVTYSIPYFPEPLPSASELTNNSSIELTPILLTQFFGPFQIQIFPRGLSALSALKIGTRVLRNDETFHTVQMQALADYSGRTMNRKPTADGSYRLEVQTETSGALPVTEHVTITEHNRTVVHLVWICARADAGLYVHDDVRRSLFIPG